MKYTTVSCLLAAFCSASHVLADAIETPAPAQTAAPELVDSDVPVTTPTPEINDHEFLRRAEQDPGATIVPTQYPSVTTQWFESTIGSATTWVGFTYTQVFASVPDQLPSAGSGAIGYGTLTKEAGSKRDVEPIETGVAGRIRL